jgi:hypothetical protein
VSAPEFTITKGHDDFSGQIEWTAAGKGLFGSGGTPVLALGDLMAKILDRAINAEGVAE